jgi:hypothetical protein
MRAREFIREFGPVGAIGSAAKGLGTIAGAATGMAKNFGKGLVKGATSGNINLDDPTLSLGAKMASALGLNQTADQLQKNKNDSTGSSDIGQAPIDKQAAARNIQGQDIELPQLGKVKVNRVTPNEIELDTSKTGLGVQRVRLNPRDLQQR